MSPPPTQLPSRVLGRYVMHEAFAQGGMATVHYGRLLGPSGFSRTVAIKRLHGHLAEDPDFVAMFLDEARLAARIHHPNVIQTLDVESSEGELFVVLDYLHGDSFSRLLQEAQRAGSPATPAIIGAILFGALEGLHAAHEARDAKGDPLEIVHRDVSPHNLLVGTDGIARVIDFGVAKARGRAQTTRDGQLKGKLSYMAPEQVRGKVTRRSDVFAASVILWEALTRKRLFTGGDDDGGVINQILHEPIPSPRQHAPLVSPELEAIVMRGLERDPSRRFATARAMALALEAQMTLATPIEVGAFVERIGGATLAQRAARVARIERGGDSIGAEPASNDSRSAPPRQPSLGGASSATAVVPGLARADHRATAEVVPESLGTGVATVSEKHPPKRRRLFSAVSIASLVGVVVGIGLALGVTFGVGRTPERSASARSATPLAAADSVQPDLSVPATATDASAVGEAPEARSAPGDTSAKKGAPRPHPRTNSCSPAYTIDARGVRHYKPECL